VDAQHSVEGVVFDNVIRFGELLSLNSSDVIIGPHTSGITFLANASQASPRTPKRLEV
jgi:hypothetical protein